MRNIFTFGLGEIFDFFDLNEEIEDAERIISTARQNVQQCEESIRNANAGLQRIQNELDRLQYLRKTVHNHDTALNEAVAHGERLRTKTIELTNKSLDISVYVGKLAAKTETLGLNFTAQDFARGVLDFREVMMSERRVSGLLENDPGALQETLEMIGRSDIGLGGGVHGHIGDIDDMM